MVWGPALGAIRRTPAGGAGKGVREEGGGLVRPVCSGTYAEVREAAGSVWILTCHHVFSNVPLIFRKAVAKTSKELPNFAVYVAQDCTSEFSV